MRHPISRLYDWIRFTIFVFSAKLLANPTLIVPKNFEVDAFAHGIQGARSLAQTKSGLIFVGGRTRHGIKVVAHKDYFKGQVLMTHFGKSLNSPNGVAIRDNDLLVAEIHRILIYKDIEKQLQKKIEPNYEVFHEGLPTKTHHGWRYIGVGPDNKIYVSVGAPCNVCESDQDNYATILRIDADGKKREIIARGVRNSVGFDWNPKTQELWFTDNGRDLLGDDTPSDELNRLAERTSGNSHFGFPFCYNENTYDEDFGPSPQNGQKVCEDKVKAFSLLGPHVAPLGMRFYRGSSFPEKYRNKVFIAEHGSWNRSQKLGYRITVVNPNQPGSYEIFAEGWLKGSEVLGRPVDILETPDGALIVSDDHAEKLWRIRFNKMN